MRRSKDGCAKERKAETFFFGSTVVLKRHATMCVVY